MSVSLHEPEIGCNLPHEIANQYLPGAAELRDDPLIHRLMLGMIQQMTGRLPCPACASPVGRDIMSGKIVVSLLRVTRCVDPR